MPGGQLAQIGHRLASAIFCDPGPGGPKRYGDVKVSTGGGKREQRVVDGGHTLNASKKIANNNELAVAA